MNNIEVSDVKSEQLAIIGTTIENLVEELDVSYMEACIIYSDKYGVEIELLGELVKAHQRISAEIKREAEELHYLKKDSSYTVEFE